MDITELGAIGELVGGAAVIGSLLYVGLQVRQSNLLAKNAADLEVARMSREYLRLGAEGDFSEAYGKCYFEPDGATVGERGRFVGSQAMWFHLLQAMYGQHQRELLPDSSWKPMLEGVVNMLDHPALAEAWEGNAMWLADDFRTMVSEARSWPPFVGRPRGHFDADPFLIEDPAD